MGKVQFPWTGVSTEDVFAINQLETVQAQLTLCLDAVAHMQAAQFNALRNALAIVADASAAIEFAIAPQPRLDTIVAQQVEFGRSMVATTEGFTRHSLALTRSFWDDGRIRFATLLAA